MLNIFIIILNWNRANDTIKCIKSLKNLYIDGCDINILVVDNASSENSLSKIKLNLRFRNSKLLVNKKNLGFSGGNNVGIKYALAEKADYIMVLNNDTRVDKKLILTMLDVAINTNNFGAASPKIYFEKDFEFHKSRYKNSDLGNVIWYAGGKIDWKNVYGFPRGVDEVDKGRYNKVEETDFATGTCMFLSRKALKKVGLFDEKFFMYYEDTDLSVRLNKAGFKVLYVPEGIVWHKVAQSSGIGSDLNDYFITRNRLLFGMRYANMRARFALFRESLKIFLNGREWQKRGVIDFYLGKFGKGSWEGV